jgi:hypothetical protein
VIQSFAYVWKNEKLCDEKGIRVANEKCTRRPKKDDNGDVGEGPRTF